MKFKIDAEIFKRFSGLNIGAVIAKNINNTGIAERVQNRIREQEKRILRECAAETLPQNPKIEVWRKAYLAFGAKPKENRSSVENLHRLILDGNRLRHVNKLVDIYNFISLEHMLPAGGEDLDKMEGDIALTFAGPNEPAVLLLGDKDPRPPHEGEVIYKDGISAICRRWNWREAERTKLTEETKNSILVIEGIPPATKAEIELAANELKGLVQEFCGGSAFCAILDENNPRIAF